MAINTQFLHATVKSCHREPIRFSGGCNRRSRQHKINKCGAEMTRRGLFSISILLLMLTGCMVGPKYTKPDVPPAPAFKETSEWQQGDGWKVAEPSDTALRGNWWELYGDIKLNELEEQVDPSNQTLKEAEANFRQARAAIRFNRAAQAPTIAVAPSASTVRASANQPYFPSSLVNNGSGDLAFLSTCPTRWTSGDAFAVPSGLRENRRRPVPQTWRLFG
jgi:hypothetical protein